MKRYLALLTLSFLSTTTLVEAVKLNILDLPVDPEERVRSLTAKAEKLEKNINYTENEGLKEAFTTKYRIVRTLIDNPLLSEQDAEAYKAANEQRNMIAANFYSNEYQGGAYEKLENIKGYSESGIYPEDSQEGRDLKEIAESIKKIWAWGATKEDKLKGSAGYLKREKRANQLLENIDEIKKEIFAEAESIKAGPLLSELRKIRDVLPRNIYGNEDYDTISNAFHFVSEVCESEYEHSIIRSVIRYRELKDKLPSLMTSYRESMQASPYFVADVLSGELLGLEEKISALRYRCSVGNEMYELSTITDKIKEIPALLKKYNELMAIISPALEEAERLEEVERLEGTESLSSSFAAPSGFPYGIEGDFPLDPFPTSSSSSSTPVVVPDLQVDNSLFSMGELSPYLSTDGFSSPEKAHIWTAGTEASITIPLARMYPRPSSVTFFGTCALVNANHTQNLTVWVNGKKVNEHKYTVDNNEYDIEIILPETELAKIEFSIPNAISPRDLTGSGDLRKLGIMFKEVLLNIEETEGQTIPLFNGVDDY